MQVILTSNAHVPLLGYNLLSLKRMADRGHKCVAEKTGEMLPLKNRTTLFGLSVGNQNYFSRLRRTLDSSKSALATIAPENIFYLSPVDINTFRASHGHVQRNFSVLQPNSSG